jgi:phosphatidylglycerol:prolipoprotein diacylglycerol transferase
VDKVFLQVGSLTIHWYGVCVALGFVAALWTASRRGILAGVSAEKVADAGPWLIIGALVGARILYVISYWDKSFAHLDHPFLEIFTIWKGGLVFYGGLMGSSLACVIYTYKNKIPLWRFADVLAPSVALGHAFGRIGCLMNGCCYGRECNLPWAIRFPVGHETYPHGVHPTQIYESALNFALYAGLAWFFRRRKFDGQVFAGYLIGYAFVRSTVELFRGDYPPEYYVHGWWTPAHWVSVAILVAGIMLYSWQRVNPQAKMVKG